MKVTYTGALPEGVVYDRDTNTNHEFVKGRAFEVSDELGRRLRDQSPADWASKEYDPAPAKSASKADWEAYRAVQGHVVDGLTKDELIDLPDTPADKEG